MIVWDVRQVLAIAAYVQSNAVLMEKVQRLTVITAMTVVLVFATFLVKNISLLLVLHQNFKMKNYSKLIRRNNTLNLIIIVAAVFHSIVNNNSVKL